MEVVFAIEHSNPKKFERWMLENHRNLNEAHLHYMSLYCSTLFQINLIVRYVNKSKLGNLLYLCVLHRNKAILNVPSFRRKVKFSRHNFSINFFHLVNAELSNALILLDCGLDFYKICGHLAAILLCDKKVRDKIRMLYSHIVEKMEMLGEDVINVISAYL